MEILKEFPVAKNGKLEPIQVKMMKMLSDMEPHWREELQRCLSDSFCDNVHPHVYLIRKHLAEEGKLALQTIRVSLGNTKYQLVPLAMSMPPSQV